MNKIAKYLNQHIVGNVFDQPAVLEKYATDRSVLRIMPQMVAIPESTTDVRRIVKFINQLAIKNIRIPITVRGSGLDKTGADLGEGLILSTEHLNKIQEIDDHSRLVRVQAGVTLGQLNSALALYGLTLPIIADPRETIGSLIANFVTDQGAGKYNGIYYYVDCLEAVLSDGDTIQTSRYSRRLVERKKNATSLEGSVYRDIDDLVTRSRITLDAMESRNTVDSAGYQMITQVVRSKNGSFDLLPLFYASQGTLGVITEVILRCEVFSPETFHLMAAFESINAALSYTHTINSLKPSKLSIYDARMFSSVEKHGKDLALFAPKFNKGFLVLTGFDDRPGKARRKLRKCMKMLPNNAAAVMETSNNATDFQRLHSAVISYLNDDTKGEHVSIVDDFYLPAERLAGFLGDLKVLEDAYDIKLPIFGSNSTCNYSIRPEFSMSSIQDRQQLIRFLKDFSALLNDHGGSITGGAPEGRTKAIVTNLMHTEEEMNVYRKIKKTFDPNMILNPNAKIGTVNPASIIKHLRTEANTGIATE